MPKIQTVTLTIPLDVFDRIFDILGSRHIVDPDTEYILSSLQSAYLKQVSPSDEPIKPIKFIPITITKEEKEFLGMVKKNHDEAVNILSMKTKP